MTEEEIKTLNGLIVEVGFKFPALWDPAFLSSLRLNGASRASKIVDQELAFEKVRIGKLSENEKKRQDLKSTFYQLAKQVDRNHAGLELEKVLNGLFELEDLSPRRPFRVVGEQIDGSFELDSEVYLVEVKWEAGPIPEGPLLVFRGKVEGKSQFTRGIFIAINGFSDHAKKAIVTGKQPNFFLMEGYDLAMVLENRISLIDLLRRKQRRLAEAGEVFVSVQELI